MLSLATLNLSATLEKGREDVQSEEKLQKAQEILFSVATTIRELSHRLTPLVIEKYGFRRAVEDMVDTINLSQKLTMQAVIVGFEDTGHYPVPFLNDLYRMLQELLHNIIKHAHARHALLELVEHSGQVSILVEDDGVGIPEAALAKLFEAQGIGVNNVNERLKVLYGDHYRMWIDSRPGEGTSTGLELPEQASGSVVGVESFVGRS